MSIKEHRTISMVVKTSTLLSGEITEEMEERTYGSNGPANLGISRRRGDTSDAWKTCSVMSWNITRTVETTKNTVKMIHSKGHVNFLLSL